MTQHISQWVDSRDAQRPVVVTGSAGFIGRRLVAALRMRGRSVVEVGHRHECDLRVRNGGIQRIMDVRPRAVVHLAASRDGGRGRVASCALENTVLCTLNTLQVIAEIPDCIFVHVGSYKQYGAAPIPFREDMPTVPASAYGYAKQVSELLVRQQRGKRAVCMRLGPVIGEGQSADNLIPRVIESIRLRQSDQLAIADVPWDPLYVDDAVAAILQALQRPICLGQTINVSSGTTSSPKRVLRAIAHMMGDDVFVNEVKLYTGPASPMVGDISRARRLLGWRPKTSLSSALQRCVRFHLESERHGSAMEGAGDNHVDSARQARVATEPRRNSHSSL